MEVRSFEPSDESMTLINERLLQMRKRRTEASQVRFQFVSRDSNTNKSPEKYFSSIRAHKTTEGLRQLFDLLSLVIDTAHKRTLRHKALLVDLQVMGMEQWEAQGKKAQFDRLTNQAIERGRATPSALMRHF